MRISSENTAALIVDFQEKLIPAMREKDSLLQNSGKLIKGLNIMGIPMLITQQYTKGLGNTVEEITSASGTTEYIDKVTFSCYKAEQVRRFLEQMPERKNVVLCGIETHICVWQTALDLKESGYRPILVADCLSSRKKMDHDITLQRALQESITVTTHESLLFEMLVRAGSEDFKKISKLIR